MGYYPLMMDVGRQPVLVAGTGAEAVKKMPGLLAAGASVDIYAPALTEAMLAWMQDGVRWIRRHPEKADVSGHAFVIAAADDATVNGNLGLWARNLGVPINVVDVPAESSVIAVSHLRRGDLVIAVSTSGRAPGLSRAIRQRLEGFFEKDWDVRLEIMARQRALARTYRDVEQKSRRIAGLERRVMEEWEQDLEKGLGAKSNT